MAIGFTIWLNTKNNEPETTNLPPTQDQPGDTTNVETLVISAEKPASFEGVEMLTYKSPAGYEITYPVNWVGKEVPAPAQSDDTFIRYTISPAEPSVDFSSMIVIRVRKTDKDIFQPDPTVGEKWVTINGRKGIFSPGPSGTETYYFVRNNMYYSILINEALIFKTGLNKQEALWVLSTFKVVE